MTLSQHTIKAKDVHLGTTKGKIKLMLYTSKTHDRGKVPQEMKIFSIQYENKTRYRPKRNFCPFELMRRYFRVRNQWQNVNEPCFIFQDGSPVTAVNARSLLRLMLQKLGLIESLYDMHSLRIGRCSDMVNKLGYMVEEAKRAGQWKSSCVYRYICH